MCRKCQADARALDAISIRALAAYGIPVHCMMRVGVGACADILLNSLNIRACTVIWYCTAPLLEDLVSEFGLETERVIVQVLSTTDCMAHSQAKKTQNQESLYTKSGKSVQLERPRTWLSCTCSRGMGVRAQRNSCCHALRTCLRRCCSDSLDAATIHHASFSTDRE